MRHPSWRGVAAILLLGSLIGMGALEGCGAPPQRNLFELTIPGRAIPSYREVGMLGPKEPDVSITLRPKREWNIQQYDIGMGWTRYGPSLDLLLVVPGVQDNQPVMDPPEEQTMGDMILALVPEEDQTEENREDYLLRPHVFRNTMTLLDIPDLFIGYLSQEETGYKQVEVAKFEPAPFGGVSGFRLILSTKNSLGLPFTFLIRGAVFQERLYFACFRAPTTHYYPSMIEEVEGLLDTAELR